MPRAQRHANGRQQLLDFEPATRRFAVFAVRRLLGEDNRLECAGLEPTPVCFGTWPVVADAVQPGAWRQPFVFANVGNSMLLQYEPTTGAYVLLHCDGGCDVGCDSSCSSVCNGGNNVYGFIYRQQGSYFMGNTS